MALSARSMDRRFARETGVAAEIAALAEPAIEELGLRLVRVNISGRDGGTVQVMVDREAGAVTIEDCTGLSRRLSPLLDAHDPIGRAYRLEVTSPGIDRPLVRPSDFEDWAGYEAKLELKELVGGRKRFRGEIEGFEDGEARLKVALGPKGEIEVLGFPVDMIAQAKLVLTDALLRAALAKRAHG